MTDALDAFLGEDEDYYFFTPPPEEVTDYWVQDLLTADKALGRVAKLDQRMNEIVDAANDKIERIERWRTDECDRLKSRRAYYEQLLAHFHASVLDTDPKAKTLRLSNGSLVARKQPDSIDIPDPEGLLILMEFRGEFIRVKRELNRSAIKEAVLKNGEIIEGVEIVPGEVRFNVSPN